MSKVEDLRNIRANHIEDIKDLQEGVKKISSKILDIMKAGDYTFQEIFDEWLENTPKEEARWLEHIEVNDKDMWDFIDYGEPSRGRRYTINEIVDYLFDKVEPNNLKEEEAWEFCQKLMEKNIGSIPYDW